MKFNEYAAAGIFVVICIVVLLVSTISLIVGLLQ
jgi:hypothetical protein